MATLNLGRRRINAKTGDGLHAPLAGAAPPAGEFGLPAFGLVKLVHELFSLHVETLDVLLRVRLLDLLDSFLLLSLGLLLLGTHEGRGLLHLLDPFLLS